MAEAITIRDRIERQLVANLGAAAIQWRLDEIAAGRFAADHAALAVVRWDERGNDVAPYDTILVPGDETTSDGASAPDITTNVLQIYAELLMARQSLDDDAEPGARVLARWLGRLEAALLSDRQLTETATSQRLAVDVSKIGVEAPVMVEGQPHVLAVVEIDVTYDTTTGDPYTGPGITERTV